MLHIGACIIWNGKKKEKERISQIQQSVILAEMMMNIWDDLNGFNRKRGDDDIQNTVLVWSRC